MNESIKTRKAVDVTTVDLLTVSRKIAAQFHVVHDSWRDPIIGGDKWQHMNPVGWIAPYSIVKDDPHKYILATVDNSLFLLKYSSLTDSFINEFGVDQLPQIFVI